MQGLWSRWYSNSWGCCATSCISLALFRQRLTQVGRDHSCNRGKSAAVMNRYLQANTVLSSPVTFAAWMKVVISGRLLAAASMPDSLQEGGFGGRGGGGGCEGGEGGDRCDQLPMPCLLHS